MGTRWSGMLAPVGVRNDDMRRVRFAENALDTRQLPIGVLWIREEGNGHDGAVIVGTIDEFSQTNSLADGAGELFDDPDTPPRLKADVEEFKLLAKKGVIGMSVRLEPEMDMEIVKEGTDEPFDPETEMAQLEAGEIELLPPTWVTLHRLARFDRVADQVAKQGFDERFRRMWRYYLAYCAAGFSTRRTDVLQAHFRHI